MRLARQHIRPILQGSIGVILILFCLPALGRAITTFPPRVAIGLFCFLAALVYSRDRARINDLFRKLWSTRNVH